MKGTDVFAVWSFAILLAGMLLLSVGAVRTRKHLRTHGSTGDPIPVSTGMFGLAGLVLLCWGVVGLAIAAVMS